MAVITISREVGSGGDRIARRLCDLLGYRYFDKALMAQVAQEQGLTDSEVVDFSEDSYRGRSFVDALLRRSAPVVTATEVVSTTRGEEARVLQEVDEEMAAAFVSSTIRALSRRGGVVVVGRGGQAILHDAHGVLHVRIVARLEDRVQRLAEAEGLAQRAARRVIDERDRVAAEYLRRFHAVDWSDPNLYHLTVNTSLLDEDAAVELIAGAARLLETRSQA